MSHPIPTHDYRAPEAVCICPKEKMAVMKRNAKHSYDMEIVEVAVPHHQDDCPLFCDYSNASGGDDSIW